MVDQIVLAQNSKIAYLRTLEHGWVRDGAYWSLTVDCYCAMGNQGLAVVFSFVGLHPEPLNQPIQSLVSAVQELHMIEIQFMFLHLVPRRIAQHAHVSQG